MLGSLPPPDAVPSDSSNTVNKSASRLDLNFTNMLLFILCIIYLCETSLYRSP